jgi:hypothetical protein
MEHSPIAFRASLRSIASAGPPSSYLRHSLVVAIVHSRVKSLFKLLGVNSVSYSTVYDIVYLPLVF